MLVVVTILIVLCIQLFDLPLAAWIAAHWTGYSVNIKAVTIPDLLPLAVVIFSGLSWTADFYLRRRNILKSLRKPCRVIGIALPMSFGVTDILKWFFGRTEARTWLSHPNLYGFHWFAGTKSFQGFPSGHMLVLTPLFLVVWHYFPRYRWYAAAIWLCLAVALLATGYHFLSDVLAGAYIGSAIYRIVNRSVA